MKKIIPVLFILAGVFLTGCGQSDAVPEIVICPAGPGPVNVTQLAIFDSGHNFGYGAWDEKPGDPVCDSYPAKSFVIQSETDFNKYSITNREILPQVDFSKNTLILLQGTVNHDIDGLTVTMEYEGQSGFQVNVEIVHNDVCVYPAWKAAILAPALPAQSSVDLDISWVRNPNPKPVEGVTVPLQYLYIFKDKNNAEVVSEDDFWVKRETPWNGLVAGKFFVIRSEADFENYSIRGREILPEVDFTTHNLILIQGVANAGEIGLDTRMFSDGGKYRLIVELRLGMLAYCPPWRTAVLGPVLADDAEIEFILKSTEAGFRE